MIDSFGLLPYPNLAASRNHLQGLLNCTLEYLFCWYRFRHYPDSSISFWPCSCNSSSNSNLPLSFTSSSFTVFMLWVECIRGQLFHLTDIGSHWSSALLFCSPFESVYTASFFLFFYVAYSILQPIVVRWICMRNILKLFLKYHILWSIWYLVMLNQHHSKTNS